MSEQSIMLSLPPAGAAVRDAALVHLVSLRTPVAVVYRHFRRSLLEENIEPPSLSSFRRWASVQIQRSMRAKRYQKAKARIATMSDSDQRIPFSLALSDQTRRLLASGLRSLANDLERDVPDAVSTDRLHQAMASILGTSPASMPTAEDQE